jgi:hypothetical protein
MDIPVCWETPGWNGRKSYIRSKVEAQYEGRIEFSVNFTGWGAELLIRQLGRNLV